MLAEVNAVIAADDFRGHQFQALWAETLCGSEKVIVTKCHWFDSRLAALFLLNRRTSLMSRKLTAIAAKAPSTNETTMLVPLT